MLEKRIKNLKMSIKSSQKYALLTKTLKYGINIHILGILIAFVLYKLNLYNAFDVKNNIFYKSFYALSPFLFFACMVLSYIGLWLALFLFLRKISNHVNYKIQKDKAFLDENEEKNKHIELINEVLTPREIREKLKKEKEEARQKAQENSIEAEELKEEPKEAQNENTSIQKT